jgi:ubiquinone/menaquinone biosynthesis C-methylase UbiE
VFAVDSDEKAIRAVENKAARRGLGNIEAHAASAADLRFIGNEEVDFVLANGLLCSMAPKDHASAVSEMKRVLKPSGRAYLSVAKGAMSYVDEAAWDEIPRGFNVGGSCDGNFLQDRWALVSIRQEQTRRG